MLHPSNNSPKQPDRLQFLKQLVHKHPFAFCGGLWVTLVLLGSMATLGLLNPGPIEQEPSTATPGLTTFQEVKPKQSKQLKQPQQPKESKQPKEQKEGLPLSLFGAVALGCAGGSLLITQALRYSTGRRQSVKRVKPTATVRKKRRHTSKTRHSVSSEQQPVSSALTIKTLNNQLTQVTVLPPEERHPLDAREESLAEMMDLRKQHSLASLMRSNY